MKKIPFDIYTDGASKGNPGPAGIGVVICQGQEVVRNISHYIGENTNNAAEYLAIIFALQEALLLKAEEVNLYTDSELIYRQLTGEYKIKNPKLFAFYQQVKQLLSGFKVFRISHVPRDANKGADKLANLALKNKK